jgi:hypothetical protein
VGSHIKLVAEIAKHRELPLYFLSGKYGFISEKEMIEDYDYLLGPDDINALVEKMRPQLKRYGVEKILFYTKPVRPWLAYLAAMQQAAMALEIGLSVEYIEADGESNAAKGALEYVKSLAPAERLIEVEKTRGQPGMDNEVVDYIAEQIKSDVK